jgi:hypothetical protein
MVVGKLKTVVVVVVLAVLAFVLRAVYNTATVQFGVLHTAESVIEQADGVWEKALAAEDAAELSKALKLYTILLNSPPLKPIVRIQSPNATAESVITAAVASAFVWLARPLRLRSLHRVAAARELLRDSRHEDDKEMLPLIAAAHSQLIAENYCDEMLSDAIAQGLASEKQEKQHRKCLAPIARGTVLFAEGGAGGPASVAAFAAAVALPGSDGGIIGGPPGSGSGGQKPALTWTTLWQLPDHHVPGLRAQPWWMELPAVAALEASFPALQAEFKSVLARTGGEQVREQGAGRPRLAAGALRGRTARAHCAGACPCACALQPPRVDSWHHQTASLVGHLLAWLSACMLPLVPHASRAAVSPLLAQTPTRWRQRCCSRGGARTPGSPPQRTAGA